uniref:TNF receptor superfamily member 11b n=1 Tax=Anas platyrhynchos platyrhynchos TaxID=8840 RepID=U3IQD3_ANAPP
MTNWSVQDVSPHKYLHYDPGTSRQVVCDQCPPGSYVKQHCTATSPTVCAPCPDQYYAEDWNSNDECQYCSAVCKELQYVKQECTSTQDRVCECIEGRYLELEFCLKHTECPPGFGVAQPGTPESDTVCKRCPEGFFSNVTSSKAACQKHTNCSALGFKIALKGNAVRDNVCQENTDTSLQKCGIGMYHIMYHIRQECSENIPLSIVIMKVSAFMLKIPTDLPATELDVASEQQHCKDRFLVLVFFKHRATDITTTDIFFSFFFISDVTLCEEALFRFAVPTLLVPNWLNLLADSLPGTKLSTENIERIKQRHGSQEQTFQLMKLWKQQNKEQDIAKKINQGTHTHLHSHIPNTTCTRALKVVVTNSIQPTPFDTHPTCPGIG